MYPEGLEYIILFHYEPLRRKQNVESLHRSDFLGRHDSDYLQFYRSVHIPVSYPEHDRYSLEWHPALRGVLELRLLLEQHRPCLLIF